MATSQCFENPPSLSSTCGSGSVQELGGLKSYVTGPQDSKLAILLISDAFGVFFTCSFCSLLNGLDPTSPAIGVECSSRTSPRLRRARPEDKGYEDAKPLISALRSKGVSSIGAAGFCWGGVVVVKLARSDDIQAGVVLHPGRIAEDDINEVKCPIAILGAETDSASPPEQMKHFGEILSAKSGVDSFVKIFPSVTHGWSVRYSDDDESAVRSAEEAHGDMLNWFTKFVK